MKKSHTLFEITFAAFSKRNLGFRKFFHPQNNVPNHYPELFYLKRRSSEPLIWHFFGGLSKSEKFSELKPPIIHELYRQIKVGGLEITETSYLVNGLENYLFLIMMALKTT